MIVSYYTDGCIIVDASRPENMVEVGNFDTYVPGDVGYSGSWGAYPYLPSGLVLMSDRDNGLFVLEPNYIRASYLEGKITNADNEESLQGAKISLIERENRVEYSNAFGDYKAGLPETGTFQVQVSLQYFEDFNTTVELNEGEITILDVALTPLTPISIGGTVYDANTNAPISSAKVRILNDEFDFELETDSEGKFNIPEFYESQYDVFAGKWSYENYHDYRAISLASNDIEIYLDKGYEDNFSLDLGWQSGGVFTTGEWERATPNENTLTDYGLNINVVPAHDSEDDPGNHCYVTANEVNFFGNVVGQVVLTSPAMDMRNWESAKIEFRSWFFNVTSPQFALPEPGTGKYEVMLSNGTETILLETLEMPALQTIFWETKEYTITNEIPFTENMQLILEINEDSGAQIVEGLFDFFGAWDGGFVNTSELAINSKLVDISPNPCKDEFQITIHSAASISKYELLDMHGRTIQKAELNGTSINIQNFQNGLYYLKLIEENEEVFSVNKIVVTK